MAHHKQPEKFTVVRCDPNSNVLIAIKRFHRLEQARRLSKELNKKLNEKEGVPKHAPFTFYMVDAHPSVSLFDAFAVTHARQERAPDFSRTLLNSRELASVRRIRRRRKR